MVSKCVETLRPPAEIDHFLLGVLILVPLVVCDTVYG
jgi:hypothetical protein